MVANDVRCVHLKNPTVETVSGAIAQAISDTGESVAALYSLQDGLDGLFIAYIEGA